jgi:hypothetical protein
MRRLLAIALLLGCAACSQDDAPAEQIAETAENIVTPVTAEQSPLAKGRFAPRDDCAKIEGADEFRHELAAAVKARDTDALVALAASDIMLDFGGGTGAAELRKRLDDKSWDLWSEFDELMELGCSANDEGGITIPWFFDQDMGEADPFDSMLVTGEDVPVYASPDAGAKAVATVSWDLVKIAALKPDDPFQQIELADKRVGFIATDKLRSVIDYRLLASSRNNRWKITSFLAGD